MKKTQVKKEARTFMPEIIAPGTGLSPLTPKSKIPTNNVHTIQDVLDGRQYRIPGGGGSWGEGEDVSTSFKDKGSDYKREERDWNIIEKMLNAPRSVSEEWKVKVQGGSKSCSSFEEAQRYIRKLRQKGMNATRMARTKQAQSE